MTAPPRILFVCTANICRSAYAQVRAQQVLPEFQFASGGLQGFDHEPMDDEMARQLRLRGADPGRFRSRPLDQALVEGADLILTMEARQLRELSRRWPSARGRAFQWGSAASSLARLPQRARINDQVHDLGRLVRRPRRIDDVADPYLQGFSAASMCALRIDRLLETTLTALAGRPVSVVASAP